MDACSQHVLFGDHLCDGGRVVGSMEENAEVMECSAKFSDCGKYRYYLYRIWDSKKPLVMCIGLNPSTANEQNNDPTINSLIKLLDGLGFGEFYMTNLFALISSKPEKLRECPDPVKDNNYWLDTIAGLVTTVIFCWGQFNQAQWMAKKIVDRFPKALCFGKTSKGRPIHPLAATVWMKSKCKLQPFKL